MRNPTYLFRQATASAFTPDDEPDLHAVWQGALQERTEIEHKHRILRHDGSIRHVSFLGRSFPTCNAETEFIGTVMDVTEQHEDREALRKSLEDNQVLLEKNKTLQEKLRGENILLAGAQSCTARRACRNPKGKVREDCRRVSSTSADTQQGGAGSLY